MKLLAFVTRDFLIAASYRFAIALRVGGLLLSLLMFYFLGLTFSGAIAPGLERYGGEYFPYVLIGIAVSSFVSVGLHALSRDVRAAQVEGTLEALLCTPTSIYTVLLGNSLWAFATALGTCCALLGAGCAFLGFRCDAAAWGPALAVLGLTFAAFLLVGILGAAFTMRFKQGNPVAMFFGTAGYFLGGVIFPVEVLPAPFRACAALLPITHAVKALRELFLAGAGAGEIAPLLGNLLLFIAVMAPASLLLFAAAVKRARREGSLVQY